MIDILFDRTQNNFMCIVGQSFRSGINGYAWLCLKYLLSEILWKHDEEISPRIVIMAVKDEGTFQLKKTARDIIR